MPDKALPEPWFSFLAKLDATLSAELDLHCLGGFVVTLVYDFSRPTADIDVLVLITGDDRFRKLIEMGRKGSPLHHRYKIYLDWSRWQPCRKITRNVWWRCFQARFNT